MRTPQSSPTIPAYRQRQVRIYQDLYAAEQEKRSRTIFAQESLKPEEVIT